MKALILYIHILAATAWIGGTILLFGLGLFLRDKAAIKTVYGYIGRFYGFFEAFWLMVLLASGIYLFEHYGFQEVMIYAPESTLAALVRGKLTIVALIVSATIIHFSIALRTHNRERALLQRLISRFSSMAIFFLNLILLWYAIEMRTLL